MLILDIVFALSVYYNASALLAMPTAVIARGYGICLSVCLSTLSVLPSHSSVLSRRIKIRSCGLQHQVGQSF